MPRGVPRFRDIPREPSIQEAPSVVVEEAPGAPKCRHCPGELAPYTGQNKAKAGRVECQVCGCGFHGGERVTQGAGCTFAPSEAAIAPAASG